MVSPAVFHVISTELLIGSFAVSTLGTMVCSAFSIPVFFVSNRDLVYPRLSILRCNLWDVTIPAEYHRLHDI